MQNGTEFFPKKKLRKSTALLSCWTIAARQRVITKNWEVLSGMLAQTAFQRQMSVTRKDFLGVGYYLKNHGGSSTALKKTGNWARYMNRSLISVMSAIQLKK